MKPWIRRNRIVVVLVALTFCFAIGEAVYFRDPACLLVRCVKAEP